MGNYSWSTCGINCDFVVERIENMFNKKKRIQDLEEKIARIGIDISTLKKDLLWGDVSYVLPFESRPSTRELLYMILDYLGLKYQFSNDLPSIKSGWKLVKSPNIPINNLRKASVKSK